MKISCCYKCTERHSNCHATCSKYIEEKSRAEELKATIKKEKELDSYFQKKY